MQESSAKSSTQRQLQVVDPTNLFAPRLIKICTCNTHFFCSKLTFLSSTINTDTSTKNQPHDFSFHDSIYLRREFRSEAIPNSFPCISPRPYISYPILTLAIYHTHTYTRTTYLHTYGQQPASWFHIHSLIPSIPVKNSTQKAYTTSSPVHVASSLACILPHTWASI